MKSIKDIDPSSILVVSNDLFFAELQVNLDRGEKVIFAVKGRSMLPFLQEGERIVLQPIIHEELKKGAIVLAKFGDRYVLHRLVAFNQDHVWLAGDGNLIQEERVAKQDIMGVATGVIAAGKVRSLQGLASVLLGLGWYYARPFRLLLFKLFGKH